MPADWIRLPRSVLVEAGAIDAFGAISDELQLTEPALVVTTTTPRSLVVERLQSHLKTEPIVVEIDGASQDTIEEVAAAGSDAGYVIGLGGGRPIDVAKVASQRLDSPFLSVPTVASHDGIASGRASIPDGDSRHSVAAPPPLAVIADTEVIADSPWKFTSAGCADVIANHTAVRDWRLANRVHGTPLSAYAAALAEMTADHLEARADTLRPGLPEAAETVLQALVSSGVAMSIAGSSRPASGAEHLVSHQLDRLAPNAALHGHQVGVAAIVVAYLQSGANGDWQKLRSALEAVDAPTSATALGVSDTTFIAALTSAHEIRDRATILGSGIEESAAWSAASTTGVVSPASRPN